MDTKEPNLVRRALEFTLPYYVKYGDIFLFHSYAFVNENIKACKEIAKAEGLGKAELLPGLLAVVFIDAGVADDQELSHQGLIDRFAQEAVLPPDIEKSFLHYLQFLRAPSVPQNKLEQILSDGVNVYLGLPDALERSDLLRIETEKVSHKVFEDEEWLELVREKFTAHPFYTDYARENFGVQRRKNYYELERRLGKSKQDLAKKRNTTETVSGNLLSNKETEDLFKIAFRNYVDLISVADRKAGLLIQVSSILVSVIIAFNIRKAESAPIYMIPTAIILICAVITAFYAVSASRPQENAFNSGTFKNNESFFFGSFDRVDRDFNKISLATYTAGVDDVLTGNKKEVFRKITEETYQVRCVLSKKFGYLATAYKVFIIGLALTIAAFLIVSIILSLKHSK
jgi:hypothetical protein